eukprot:scaffold7558_cov277-Pinguiococcus_pyrenoidosus.AAC.2
MRKAVERKSARNQAADTIVPPEAPERPAFPASWSEKKTEVDATYACFSERSRPIESARRIS